MLALGWDQMAYVIDDALWRLINAAYSHLPPDGDWLPILARPVTKPGAGLKKHVGKLVDAAAAAVHDGETKAALNLLALAFHVNAEEARAKTGENGLFRASKSDFRATHIATVVAGLLGHARATELPDPIIEYLRSTGNLLKLGAAVSRLHKSLIQFLSRKKFLGVKSILAYADALFMLEHSGKFYADKNTVQGYTKEDIAEAASFILHLQDKRGGVGDVDFGFSDDEAISDGLYAKILIKACKIRQYCEAEILIDAFDYRCELKKRAASISAPYPELEQSIKLGYIQAEMAKAAAPFIRIQGIRQGEVSLISVANEIYQRSSDQIVERRDFPTPRYVFTFPDAPAFRDMIRYDGLTIEEKIYVQEITSDEHTNWEELRDFELVPNLTFLDLLKVHRLFSFISRFNANTFKANIAEEPDVVYRSLIPVFRNEQFRRVLEIALPAEKVDDALRLLTWKSGDVGVLDIQYRPIIEGPTHLMVPMNIAGTANWYRNLTYTSKRRVIEDAKEEGASKALAAALAGETSWVRREYKTKLNGKTIEVDVLCRLEDTLFVFECKHAFFPCNRFELRTSYKHIQTASKQLTRIVDLLQAPKTELELYKRLGWPATPAKSIVTCIVSCNGMFPGLRLNGHPVRRISELVNMIETGDIKFMQARTIDTDTGPDAEVSDAFVHSMWDSDKLTASFLIDYIKNDKLNNIHFDSLIDVDIQWQIDDFTLTLHTYAMDPEKAATAFRPAGE